MLIRFGAVVGLVAIAAYCSFPLQWAVGSTLSPLRAYISELSVRGQPGALGFQAADAIAGLGLIALAVALAVWRPTGRMLAGSSALAVAGGASIVDSAAPMICAPSIDKPCRLSDQTDMIGQLVQPHALSGVIGFTAVLLALALFSSVLSGSPSARLLGGWGWAATAAGVVLGLVEVGMALRHVGWVGLLERVQVSVISVWLAALTFRLLAAGGGTGPSTMTPAARLGRLARRGRSAQAAGTTGRGSGIGGPRLRRH